MLEHPQRSNLPPRTAETLIDLMETSPGCSRPSLIHENSETVKKPEYSHMIFRRPFLRFYEAMEGWGTLGMVSADSHWAGISKKVRQSSVGGLVVEIIHFKVCVNFPQVFKDFQPSEGSWASWGGPGSQGDLQAHSPWVVDRFGLWNFSNQTSIPRDIRENCFWVIGEDAGLCLWHCLHFPRCRRTGFRRKLI